MSAAGHLAHTYRYIYPSSVSPRENAMGLSLATSGGREPNPYFFQGFLRQPKDVADQLLVLAKIIETRFFMPINPRLFDPVVTSNDGVLRFEGFSSCCGVYARADVLGEAFEAELVGRGTTNVDFNAPMRAALGRIRAHDRVSMAVGATQLMLHRDAQGTNPGESVVEKKVKLPVRWIKGFTEVQAYMPKLKKRFEVAGPEARQFILSLPSGAGPRQPAWVTPLAKGLRLSMRDTPGSVRITGTNRLRIVEPLVASITGMHVWSDDGAGTSLWELRLRSGRFVLLLSPEVSRGFSGEGQALSTLAAGGWEAALPRVQAELAWQARISPSEIASRTGIAESDIQGALAALGTRGLVGYDVAEQAYFHREMPFDLAAVESLHPRLKAARALVADKKVRITQREGTGELTSAVAMVQGTDVEHHVRLGPMGDKCTCPWYSKNQGERGSCKHVLAARIVIDGDEVE